MFIMSLNQQHHSLNSLSSREKVGMRGSSNPLSLTPSPQPSPSGRGGLVFIDKIANNQKGITLIGALFIIVVMALLGTGLLQLTTTSQQSIGQELTSVKAYFAAQSALQWGMYQATFAAATGTHTISFNQQGLINTRAITTLSANNLGGLTYYQINADGRYGGSGDREYSRRQLLLHYRL